MADSGINMKLNVLFQEGNYIYQTGFSFMSYIYPSSFFTKKFQVDTEVGHPSRARIMEVRISGGLINYSWLRTPYMARADFFLIILKLSWILSFPEKMKVIG